MLSVQKCKRILNNRAPQGRAYDRAKAQALRAALYGGAQSDNDLPDEPPEEAHDPDEACPRHSVQQGEHDRSG
jgi:hypothetical protein